MIRTGPTENSPRRVHVVAVRHDFDSRGPSVIIRAALWPGMLELSSTSSHSFVNQPLFFTVIRSMKSWPSCSRSTGRSVETSMFRVFALAQ